MSVVKVVALGHKFQDEASQTPETRVVVGDTVEWGSMSGEHTIVSDNVAPFDALEPPLEGTVDNGSAAYAVKFNEVGTYGYHCDIHGGNPVNKTGMYGIVRVNPAKS